MATPLASLAGCPPEILRAILSRVEGTSSEMLRLALVSRRWTTIAIEAAFSRVSVKGRRNLLSLFCRVNGNSNAPVLRGSLSIIGVGDCALDSVRIEDKHFIAPLCTHLHTLNLTLVPDWRWLPSLHIPRLPSIRKFRLEIARRQVSTYTNSTRLLSWWLCACLSSKPAAHVEPRAAAVTQVTNLSIIGAQWLDHISHDYQLPHFLLNELEMKECAGERSDLFLRLLKAGVLETLTIDESAMPCLLTSSAPRLRTLIYEGDRRQCGRWTPYRALEILILQWKHLETLTLPLSCRTMTLHSDSVQRLELRCPDIMADELDWRHLKALVEDVTSLRQLTLPQMASMDVLLARKQPSSSRAELELEQRRLRQHQVLLQLGREMALRGVRVNYRA